MMKFFRRHTKHLLAVFMALLLVVWLLGDYIEDRAQANMLVDIDWGQALGEKVTSQSASAAGRDREILDRLGFPWQYFWLMGQRGQLMQYARTQPLSEQEWFMLDLDARRRGLYVPEDQIARIRENLTPQQVEAVRKTHKAGPEDIDRALESLMRIQTAFGIDTSPMATSEADIQHFIRETAEKARARFVVLTPQQFVDNAYQPTEDELKAQFEKYKDKDKSFGEDGYGYRLPEEVKIEYIAVHQPALAEKQQVSHDEAFRYWKDNQSQFTTTQPATNPASAPVRKQYENYEAASQAVRTRLQNDRAKNEALRIATEIAKTLNAAWVNQPTTQPGGYKEVPSSAKDEQLYPRIMEEFRKRYGDVVTFERTQFHSAVDFNVLGPVANARALAGTSDAIGLTQAAFLVQGLEADRKTQPRRARFFHNLYETLPEPFVDNQGTAYVFRTIDIRPKRSPASWEVVRQDLIEDLRLQRAAQTAKEQAAALTEQARKVGLEQAVNQDEALKARLGEKPVLTPEPFARKQGGGFMGQLMPTYIPQVGSDEELINTVFSMAPATATQPSRVALYTPQRGQRWIIAELVEILPVTQDEYQKMRERVSQQLMVGRQVALTRDWLSPASIRQRVQWKPAHPEDELKEEGMGMDPGLQFFN